MKINPSGVTRLFLLADLHLGSKKKTSSKFRQGLDNMFKKDPKAGILINGDLTTAGSESQYTEVWNFLDESINSSKPVILSLGNHDVRGPKSESWNNYQESDPRYFREHVVPSFTRHYLRPMFGSSMNQLYYTLTVGCCHFIVLNTEKGLKDSTYLSRNQVQWLDRQLSEGEDQLLINFIVVHQPLWDTHWRSNFGGGFGLQDAIVKDILRRHPDTFILTAHIHNGFGVCEVIERDFGTCIDMPAFSVSENGHIGDGLGYYAVIDRHILRFEAWDFVQNVHLSQYDFKVRRHTLASYLEKFKTNNQLKEAFSLMTRFYDQHIFNDPATDNSVAAPDQSLYSISVRKRIDEIKISEQDEIQSRYVPSINWTGYERYFSQRDNNLIALHVALDRLHEIDVEQITQESRLNQYALRKRLATVLSQESFYSDEILSRELQLVQREIKKFRLAENKENIKELLDVAQTMEKTKDSKKFLIVARARACYKDKESTNENIRQMVQQLESLINQN